MTETAAKKSSSGTGRGIVIAAVVIALLLAIWIAPNIELRTEVEDEGYGREALRNPYLAAEHYLAKLGVPTSSTRSLKHLRDLPDTSTGLVLQGVTQYLQEDRAEALYDWVENGGQLVVSARFLSDERSDPLLSKVGVELRETDHTRDDLAGLVGDRLEDFVGEDAAEQFLEDTEGLLEEALDVEPLVETEDAKQQRMTTMLLPSGDTALALNLNAYYGFYNMEDIGSASQEASYYDELDDDIDEEADEYEVEVAATPPTNARDGSALIGSYGSDFGQHILQYNIGQGTLTLLSPNRMWVSRRIDNEDHAYFLWWLSQDVDSVAIIYGAQMPSIFRLLWDNLFECVLSGGLLLLAWLVYRGRRFGAIDTQENQVRRSLIEHQTAVGQFLWQHKQSSVLVGPARRALEHTLRKSHLGFSSKNPSQQTELIADRYGVPAETTQLALHQHYDEKTPELFVQIIAAIQTIRSRL